MRMTRTSTIGACIAVVASGALWGSPAAGFDRGGGNGGGGGGGGGGGSDTHRMLVDHVRRHVDGGVGVMRMGREHVPWASVRHFGRPKDSGRHPEWYLDAAALGDSLSGTPPQRIAQADRFDLGLLTHGCERVRRARKHHIDMGASPIIGSQQLAKLVYGGVVTAVGVGQEGFSLLFARADREGWSRKDHVIPPDTLGMRFWVAPAGGVQTGLRQAPFTAVGADLIGTKHHPLQVTELRFPEGLRLCLVPLGIVDAPQIVPWVADAVPAFHHRQQPGY